nr:outer membrane lipoprotein-sorting protein [Membranihabitans marinus]
MTIIRPKWNRTLELKCWADGLEQTLIYIEAPTRDRGISYLKLDDEIWNWQPKIERTIKLPPSMMSQSWMGSDFTNDDLVKHSSLMLDYRHEIIGEDSFDNFDCYKLRLKPKENAAVVWGELIIWISKKDFMQLKTEFYDEDLMLINTLTASKIRKFGNRTLPSVLKIIPENKADNSTTIEYLHWEFDKPIPAAYFTIQNMKKQL